MNDRSNVRFRLCNEYPDTHLDFRLGLSHGRRGLEVLLDARDGAEVRHIAVPKDGQPSLLGALFDNDGQGQRDERTAAECGVKDLGRL